MNMNMKEALEILERTPNTLEYFLSGLSNGWLYCDEGEDTWNASEVISHLIEAEKTNWMPRLKTFFDDEGQKFPPFDRFQHLNQKEETIHQKLLQFKTVRTLNIYELNELIEPELHFELTAFHPQFGEVKLKELLSTWVVHDLTHISQIVRVMAKRYKEDVGPWKEYLSILK